MNGDVLYNQIENYLTECNIIFNKKQAKKLCVLVRLLLRWSKAYNLTSIKSQTQIVTAHIMDCAVTVPYIEGADIADVGTGAGFPGLVLAVLCPERHFLLIDAVAKKTSFVLAAVSELELDNVKVSTARSENLIGESEFDTVVSRAVAPLSRLIPCTWHLLRPHGKLLAMKASIVAEELEKLPPTVKISELIPLKVPGMNAVRHLVKLERAT